MKRVHLLRASGAAGDSAELFGALRGLDVRVGWLDLADAAQAGAARVSSEVPAELGAAADAGAFRAVRAGGGRTLSVKPVAGPPELRSLLREHFSGCALVLVRAGGALGELAEISAAEEGWEIRDAEGRRRLLDGEQLAAALRKPGFPFGGGREGPRAAAGS